MRVTNLSENARDSDLQELFGRIGEISRIFLSKVRVRAGVCWQAHGSYLDEYNFNLLN